MKLKRRTGSAILVSIGVAAVILLFGLFFLELQQFYDYQYAIEVRAQRAINSTVEYAMDDTWRADGYNLLDCNTASARYKGYLDADLNVDASGRCFDSNGKMLYKVSYGPLEFLGATTKVNRATGKTQRLATGLRIKVTVTMTSGLGSAGFGSSSYSWSNTFESTNFRTDNNERAGAQFERHF